MSSGPINTSTGSSKINSNTSVNSNNSVKPITITDVVIENVKNTKKILDFLYSVFNQSNILLLIWFLAIYFVTYLILGIFYQSDDSVNTKLLASRIFDLVILLSVLLIVIHQYLFTDDQQKWTMVEKIGRNVSRFINDPRSIVSLLLFIFVLYSGVFITGIPMTYKDKPISISFIESSAWILLCITMICSFFDYLLNIDLPFLLSDSLQSTYNIVVPTKYESKSGNVVSTSVGIKGNSVVSQNSISTPSSSTSKLEVFNVSDNIYTYEDAQAVCKSYGARLANYDDIEDAYNNGAEWCNYGWSDNQMIFFPTQRDTWNQLQKDPANANKCGRPGINGGYIDNPYLTFGINCFGVKPDPTADELTKLKAPLQVEVIPETPEQQKLNEKVQYWAQHQNDMRLNAFNHREWSEYS
jgi:hypothetical protein